jgi:uncharacterized protein (TIGR00645 family)
MNRTIKFIEALLFGGRLLLIPIYVAMLALLVMLVIYFIGKLVYFIPSVPAMRENDIVVLTLSLIDLSLTANLVVLVIASGYENFVKRVEFQENDTRPKWLVQIDFTGLKLKLLGAITVIAAVHLLASFLVVDKQSDRALFWQVIIIITFALAGLILAYTDKVDNSSEH